ncbi:hypothetical protein D3C85_1579650 [compost metagenome]
MGPLPRTHITITGAQTPAHRNQQADGQVGDIFGQRADGCGHADPAIPGVSQVHRIGANAIDRHHFQFG